MLVDANGKSLVDHIYPIGSVYISFNSTDPKAIFGGTWERIKGYVLGGINENDIDTNTKTTFNQKAGTKIGSKYLQQHSHKIENAFNASSGAGDRTTIPGYPGNSTGQYSLYSNLVGDGDAQNIQPTILVYIWKRTA